MELLLPFLLDADLSPNRLDPAGTNAKGMKDNLLDDDQPSRTGYAWIEFSRLDDGGRPSFVTLGAGLRASQSAPGADPWYFVTTLRVGHGLAFEDQAGQPLTRERLRAALGTQGKICENASEYRDYVDQTLFGLGKERYQALVELLIQLRKPQLSKSLDPELLARALGQSLPPLNDAMITRIADAFSELEKQQRALAEVRKSRDVVGNFLETYEGYAKILAKTKSSKLVEAVRSLDAASKKLSKLQSDQEKATKAIAALDADLARLKKDESSLSGKIDALKASPEAKQAANLEQLHEFAKSLREQANSIKQDVDRLTAEIQGDVAKLQEAERRFRDALQSDIKASEETRLLAATARVDSLHEILSARPAGEPLLGEIEQRWDHRLRSRFADLRALDSASEQVRKAETMKQARDGELSGADEKHRTATENVKAARSTVQIEREAAEAAAESWRVSTTRLHPSNETFDRILKAFDHADLVQGQHITILRGEAATLEDILTAERERLAGEKVPLAQHQSTLLLDIARWRSERDSPPPAPAWARSDRRGRSGAPFYRLVDFQDGVEPSRAACIEAALTGSGLLDSWVLQDGSVEGQAFDSFAIQQTHAVDDSLGRLLKPVANAEVPAQIIEGILSSIRVLPSVTAPAGHGGLTIGQDGTWSSGVIIGRTTKTTAEHVGEVARERSRLRKIQLAEEEVGRLKAAIQEIDEQIKTQNESIQALRADVSSFPSLVVLSAQYTALAKAQGIEENTRGTLIDAQRRVAAARDELEKQQRLRRDMARERGLEDILDILASAKENLTIYQQRCTQWFRIIETAARAKSTHEDAQRRLSNKQGRLEEARGRFTRKDAEAAGRESELATLQKTAGKAVEKLRAELETATSKLVAVRAQHETTDKSKTEKVRELSKIEAWIETAAEALETADRTRRDLATALDVFRATGLIELALGLEVPSLDEDELADLILSKTVDVKESTTALEDATNLVHPRYQALARDLPQDYTVSGSQVHDAFVVTIAHVGKESTARQMHISLRAEAEVQAALLEKHEAEIIQKHLFGEVSSQIRTQIREANELVQRMNKQLEAHPTASGLKMKLQWNTDVELGKPAERALALIRKSQNLLTEQEKRNVTEFLQDCQRRAREEMPAAPQAEQLMRALDYRQWYRFDLYWKKPGQNEFTKLTKKSHATGSAGEKAVALYLPLFSAAAAHFDSARDTAPRLVLLDEVFAGVDQTTRGSCMGLLVDFDLDVMMTAFSEWGCYAEVPGIAIYHLERDPEVRGVLATPFWWDGHAKRPLEPEARS